MSRHLTPQPPAITLVSGASRVYAALGATNPVHWAFLQNASQGTIDADTGLYTAGAHACALDILRATDAAALQGIAYANVIASSNITAAGKAIIIAGGKAPDDPVTSITTYLADEAYNTLRYRGYSKTNILYLSYGPNHDVDGDGVLNDIAGSATLSNAAVAVTNWALGNDRLFVYLVDHGSVYGGNGYFRLNDSETLAASQMDAWLNTLQTQWPREVTVLMDFCFSGTFLPALARTGTPERVVVAACGGDQLTYFVAGGVVSFSDAFLGAVLQGYSIQQSFLIARGTMSTYQDACMDDDGDGVYRKDLDGGVASVLSVGASSTLGRDVPQIGDVSPNMLLAGDNSVTLWAGDVSSVYPLERVWCVIIPPSHDTAGKSTPVTDLPEIDLVYDPIGNRYEGASKGFSEPGVYKVVFCAEDVWQGRAAPKQAYVTQSGFDERAIIVAAGLTNSTDWVKINAIAGRVYHTLRRRLIDKTHLLVLSSAAQDFDGDGTNDVAAIPSVASVTAAITNWALPSRKLTVFLIGDASNVSFRVNASEWLGAEDVNRSLNAYQSGGGVPTVVLECPGASGFLPLLTPPPGWERIVIAAAKSGQPCCWLAGGLLSFTSGFASGVFSGDNIGQAFARGRDAIGSASGRVGQEARFDDNGDGVYTKADGAVARQRYIGSAFVTGAEMPEIGSVMPAVFLSGTNGWVLWASGVTAMVGVSNVFCLVTPPDYAGVGDLPQTNLTWNAVTQRYEALYTNFSQKGTYTLTFLAQDNAGEICSPVQSTVDLGDAFEPDDGPEQATGFNVGMPQVHNLHSSNDVDWVKFYAPAGEVFTIEAEQLGTNSDLTLEVYYEQADGKLTNLTWLARDESGVGQGEGETTVVNLKTDPSLEPGLYFVRVGSADPTLYGPGSEYELRIWIPAGGGPLLLVAFDKLHKTMPPPGTVAIVDGVTTQAFGTNTSLMLSLADGVHTVRVPAVAGYLPEEDPDHPGQVNNASSMWYGNPKQTVVANGGMPGMAIFQFVPVVQAQGMVRDAWTGAWLDGAGLEFRALNGCISGLYYRAWPPTTYGAAWVSGVDGTWPTNVWLPAVNWDLTIRRDGYTNAAIPGVIARAVPGAVTNLGTLWLTPLDANGNGVADAWEQQYFPGKTLVLTNDADGDGMNNLQEYLCGTDPTNKSSVLEFLGADGRTTNGFTLSWPVAPGRRYRVLATDALPAGLWPLTHGPWDVTNGQTLMEWTDTNGGGRTNRFYRIQLETP